MKQVLHRVKSQRSLKVTPYNTFNSGSRPSGLRRMFRDLSRAV
jgi:hypothetical protein